MKQIIVNHEQLQTRVALSEDGKMQEYHIETVGDERLVGSVYKGIVRNLESSLQAAFVDVGMDKNAFLHYWDMIPATVDAMEREDGSSGDDIDEIDEILELQSKTIETQKSNESPSLSGTVKGLFNKIIGKKTESEKPVKNRRRRRGPRPEKKVQKNVDIDDIPKRFSVNSTVTVQVTKGPIGTKGPRVTTNISIPGRYIVLCPNTPHIGISKRIEDRKERMRLRNIFRDMNLPKGIGVICRTASAGVSEQAFRIDACFLLEKWKNAQQLLRQPDKRPVCIYQEQNLLEQTIRDSLAEEIDEIIVDSKDAYDLATDYLKKLDGEQRIRVKSYSSPTPIFEHYKLAPQIRQIYQRVVPLPSGGELCFDETEALIAIDVNSKKSRKGKDHPETILNTNLEAAAEIGRQLRLRNIGGLIIVDFIDMRSRKDRHDVYQKLKDALDRDRAKTKLLPISKLGLLEMTRQREYQSLQDSTYENCEYCSGRGLIKSSMAISVELQRRIQALLRSRKGKTAIRVIVHPSVLQRLKSEDADILEKMEEQFGGDLTFRADSDIHQEEFRLVDTSTGKKL